MVTLKLNNRVRRVLIPNRKNFWLMLCLERSKVFGNPQKASLLIGQFYRKSKWNICL